MRKIQKLSFYGILGIVICALIFIGISSLQASSIGKKPVPPPEANWAVQILTAGNTNLYGDGATYINNDNDVRIKVEKGSSRLRKGQTAFHYSFCFKLVNPTGRHAGFQGVVFDQEQHPDGGPYCIFPEPCGTVAPICLGCFINQNQPHPEYEYFYLKFWVGQGSFTKDLGYIIDGIEDVNWNYNVPVKFRSFSDGIKLRVQNQEDFPDPPSDSDYHNVECDKRNHDDVNLENMNIWIERREEYRWRIYVGINPLDPTGSHKEDLWVQEQYTKRAEGKEKKGGKKTVTVVPLEATGNFSFYIDFIKNPT